jgi:hypothetical protein
VEHGADSGFQGISLSMEQYTALVALLPDIERVLKSKGVEVPRPKYDKAALQVKDQEEDSAPEEEDEEDEEEAAPSKSKAKLSKFKMKSNHDATSDEDED